MDLAGAEAFGVAGGLAGEAEGGFAGGQIDDFDVVPGDAVGESGADGLHEGLFGGEAGGEAFVFVGFAEGVGDLAGGEDAVEEAVSEAVVGVGNARNFGEVGTNRENHALIVSHGRSRTDGPASRMESRLWRRR